MRRPDFIVIGVVVLCGLLFVPQAQSQFIEDALRFASPGLGVGARTLALGNAYTGVANDFSALYWNPAGLAQMEYGEFSFGLSHFNFRNNGTLMASTPVSSTNNATNLNALGLTLPVEVKRGSLVFGFGFQRQANFTTGLSFEGFNPLSSIIQSYAPDGAQYPDNMTLAEYLNLATADTTTGRYISPITDSLTQSGQVLEGGGINHWSFGGAIDVAKNVSVGVTLSYATGTYTYDRSYTETDTRNVYRTFPDDLEHLTIDEFVESDITGFGAKLGLMYRVPERFRFGLAVKLPVTYQVKEDFGTTARAFFDNGDAAPTSGPYEDNGHGEYDVITPWVMSAGASATVGDLMLSGDVEYTDWTQLEFSDAAPSLIALNKDIKQRFRPTAEVRAGAEYNISMAGVRVRGGFMYSPSPFEGDPSSFDRKTISGGLGILMSESTMLDLAYAHGWWNSYITNYDGPSRVDQKIRTNTFLATFSYRF